MKKIDEKLLSLCIPTFNRCSLLDSFIKNVIEESKGIENEIEVCISDNASNDETEKTVKKLSKSSKITIKFRKNAINVGYDKNATISLGMASGKYCWLLGDDDEFSEGKLRSAVDLLKKNEPDYVFFNVAAKGTSRPFFFTEMEPNMFSFTAPEFIHALIGSDFGKMPGSFMGSHCFRRKLLENVIAENKKEMEKYYGCALIHYVAMFFIIRFSRKIIVENQSAYILGHGKGNNIMLPHEIVEISIVNFYKIFRNLMIDKIITRTEFDGFISYIIKSSYLKTLEMYVLIGFMKKLAYKYREELVKLEDMLDEYVKLVETDGKNILLVKLCRSLRNVVIKSGELGYKLILKLPFKIKNSSAIRLLPDFKKGKVSTTKERDPGNWISA